MSKEKSLIVRQELTLATWQMIKEIAPAIITSRLFGVQNESQATMIMLKGYELGFSFTSSFEFIQVIEGKPGLNAKGMRAKILASSQFDDMKVIDEFEKCTVWMKRKNGFEYQTTFTLEDAKKAGLVKPKGGYEKWQSNMLRARATTNCATVVFPDVIGGMLSTDELGSEITEGDNVWEPEPIIENDPPIIIEQEIELTGPILPDYGYTLQTLLETYSDKEIMAVNNNQLPVTPEDINLVAYRLAGTEAKDETVGS